MLQSLIIFYLCIQVLKKVKHRVVENMSSTTADTLGLSRAILCNGMFDYRKILKIITKEFDLKF